MRLRLIGILLVGMTLLLLSSVGEVRAQGSGRRAPIYDAPGYYGMSWGSRSFGVPRTHSNFTSPFGGVGYGYGFDQYHLSPGRFGVGLWRPSFANQNLAQGGLYRTFPVPRGGYFPPPGVPVGYYAPSLGGPIFVRP